MLMQPLHHCLGPCLTSQPLPRFWKKPRNISPSQLSANPVPHDHPQPLPSLQLTLAPARVLGSYVYRSLAPSLIVTNNSMAAWEQLLHFPTSYLHVHPQCSSGHRSLAPKSKGQIQEEASPAQYKSKPKKKVNHHTEVEVLR